MELGHSFVESEHCLEVGRAAAEAEEAAGKDGEDDGGGGGVALKGGVPRKLRREETARAAATSAVPSATFKANDDRFEGQSSVYAMSAAPGVGTYALEALADEYPRACRVVTAVFPSEADAVAEALRLWRQTHPAPRADSDRPHATQEEGGAAAVNELLFREWLDELRGYSQCYHETRPGESLAQAQQRHLEHVQYVSTVGEHLEGKPVQAALDARHSVGGEATKRQRVLQRRVRDRAAVAERADAPATRRRFGKACVE